MLPEEVNEKLQAVPATYRQTFPPAPPDTRQHGYLVGHPGRPLSNRMCITFVRVFKSNDLSNEAPKLKIFGLPLRDPAQGLSPRSSASLYIMAHSSTPLFKE